MHSDMGVKRDKVSVKKNVEETEPVINQERSGKSSNAHDTVH